jgi:hypothetical protein
LERTTGPVIAAARARKPQDPEADKKGQAASATGTHVPKSRAPR